MSYLLRLFTPIEDFLTVVSNLVITDDYLERREQEWEKFKPDDFYLS